MGYFSGISCYWCIFLTNHACIDQTLDTIATSGLHILYIWGFNDVTSIPDSDKICYLADGAEERGIKLIIRFVKCWTDFGGMPGYISAFGGANNSEWYYNDAAQFQYRKYVSAVVERYRDSDAIFGNTDPLSPMVVRNYEAAMK
ncbi:hypothetical protein CEP53_001014 [Fusarium sp. AF-6]|nr:hypothetical protein CEP53_001014 [Fusarium sp. AF-6]